MSRSLFIAVMLVLCCCFPRAHAGEALAPVEARVPFAPVAFPGTDGRLHLAYELHVTNFYGDTGPLKPRGLQVYADDSKTPLLVLDREQLSRQVRPTPADNAEVSIPAGKRVVVFV